jgi:hypothetical protein
MYCQYCGTAIGDDYRFCAACGRALGAQIVQRAPSRSNLPRHLQILGSLWIVVAVLNLLGAGALFLLSHTPLLVIEVPFLGPNFFPALFGMLTWLVLVKAVACFAAGFGLLEHRAWARPLAIVLAFISLIKIPIGTALGIYTLWVLLPARAEEEYRLLAVAT